MIRRLLVHSGALALLLSVLWPLATVGGVFHADEGAVLAEVRVLADTGEWTAPNPQPDIDPEMEALPLELSERFEGGRWAPYLKHPMYALLVRAGNAVGPFGWVLPGLLGTAVAAFCCGLLTERLRPGLGPWAVWAVGVATPLLFQTYVVQAHALGAGLAAAGAVAADRFLHAGGRARAGAFIALSLAGVAGVLVRTESLFIGAALAAGIAVAGRLARPALLAFAGTLGLVVAAWRLESSVLMPVLGDGASIGTVLAGRAPIDSGDPLGGLRLTVLDASYGTRRSALIGALGALSVWVCALGLRRRSDLVVKVGAVAAVTGVAARALEGGLVPGLLVATPLLAGLVGLDRSMVSRPTGSLLAVSALLFTGAVAVTQYDNGGGATWGGRFFAVGIPLVVPLAVAGWAQLVDRTDVSVLRIARAAAAATVVLMAILAVGSMRKHRGQVEEIVDSVLAARAEAGPTAPVVSTSGIPTRFAWEHVDEGIWLTVDPDLLDRYLDRLEGRSERVVLVTFDPQFDLPLLEERYRVVEDRGPFTFVLEAR